MPDAFARARDDLSEATLVDAFDALADDLRARVKGELEPGERLLWAARSDPPARHIGYPFYAFALIAVVLFALGMFASFKGLEKGRVSDGSPLIAGMFFSAVALIIMLSLIGNWITRAKQRIRDARVLYAI